MAQKQILDFFSPSNFPPKGGEREGEPPVSGHRKKKKIAAQQTDSNKRKRTEKTCSVPKRVELNNTRNRMEKAVENINDLFNTKCDINAQSMEKEGGISLETINVNSIIDMSRLVRMKSLLKQWDNDISVLVDTRIQIKKAGLLKRNGSKIFATDKPFRGIIIQISSSLDPEELERDEEDANYITVTFNLNGKKVGLIGVYAPNNDEPRFFSEKINKAIAKLSLVADDYIIAGDFNVNLSTGIGYSENKSSKKRSLEEMVKRWGLKDTIKFKERKFGVEPLTYIHTTKNRGKDCDAFPLKAARLDAIYTTIDPANTRASIGRFYPSDHASVRNVFREIKETGTKVWKMNIKILEDEMLIKKWKSAANNLTEANESLITKLSTEKNLTKKRRDDLIGRDAYKRWGDLLGIVKASAIETTREKIKDRAEAEEKILGREEINNLDKEELDDILEELNNHESDKIKIKTEIKNFQMNEANKKLAKHKVKLDNQSRKINKISIDRRIITDPDKIKDEIQRYYKYQFRCACKNKKRPRPCAICKADPVVYAKRAAKNFKKRNYKQSRLSTKQKEKLDLELTMHEVDDYVIKKLKSKMKSPGPDGIPYEFFVKTWKEIRTLVFRIISWIFEKKKMPKNMPEGLIVFLPKKGKDKSIIKNLRPLTLLNTLYKITSGILAERIKQVLPSIISEDQYGFMAGKQAADLIEITREIIEDASTNKKNLSIFAIDFSGAFDNVSYKAIIDALYRRGFGREFTTRIAALLSNNESRIIVNGRFKSSIRIEKSCRQGDPISQYLFIVVLDQLLNEINHVRSLKGYELRLGKNKIKMRSAAFADDCYTFLTGNKKQIKSQFETVKKILKNFEKKTGLGINVTKSELTVSGPLATEESLEIGGIMNKNSIKMLGVNVGTGADIKSDIKRILGERIAFWNKFHYNEVDKIEIMNAFIIPSVIHMLRHATYDRATQNILEKMTTDFIWGNKRRYISKHILYQKLQKGGLGAVPIGKVWIKVLRSWFTRAVTKQNQAPILRAAELKYEKLYGHKPSHLFRYGIIAGNRIKKSGSVLESSFELSRKAWSDSLDVKELEDQPLLENKRILKDKATKDTKDNLPALNDETIPTAFWLREELEKIENKTRKNLTDILTAHLKNRLDPRLKTFLTAPPIREPETRTATLRKFINATASSTLVMLKLESSQAEERILKTAKKTLEASDQALIKFEAELGLEIKKRNQSKNNHLDNKLLRIRQKMKYDSLLTNDKLKEWKVIDDGNCSFCGTLPENLDHLLNNCAVLKPLWEEVEEKSRCYWGAGLTGLDKSIGSRLDGSGKRKAEKLFLKVLWRLWGIKHGVNEHKKVTLAIERLRKTIFAYVEIINFDSFD